MDVPSVEMDESDAPGPPSPSRVTQEHLQPPFAPTGISHASHNQSPTVGSPHILNHTCVSPSSRKSPVSPNRPLSSPSMRRSLHEPTAPRLVIKKLVLYNFKSYAGTQEIGPFDSHFSAVVGPNGSGKSNVIDALLFVFGFRASKLRHDKLANLIHNSSQCPNCTFCKVEIIFEDVVDMPDGTCQTQPDSQLVVSRAVSKENVSVYEINGRNSSYSEVTTLLKSRGIDLEHKRFLILQGEVESIAMMKPKAESESDDGLLEYLEDIIGTSDYKKILEDLLVEIEGLKQDAVQKLERKDMSEKELNTLDEIRQRIYDCMKAENDISLRRHHILQYRNHLARIKLDELNTTIIECNTALEKEQEKNSGSLQQLADLKDGLASKTRAQTAMKKQLDEYTAQLRTANVNLVKIQTEQNQFEAKEKKLSRTIKSHETEISNSNMWIENSSSDMAQLDTRIKDNEEQLSHHTRVLRVMEDSLKDKTASITAQIEKVQHEVEPWRVKIAEEETLLATWKSELNFIDERRRGNEAEFAKVKEDEADIAVKGIKAKKHVAHLESSLKALGEELETVQSQVKVTEEKLNVALTTANQQRAAVASANEARSATQSQNKLGKALTQLAESGELRGFFGRLGSLGTIDPKYNVAVSTAAPRLDDFVVDTVETAQRCIKFLREKSLGWASFIVLDKLRNQNLSKINTPFNAPRLFDLVVPRDNRFAAAFYSVMENTLIAENMTQARQIAFQSQSGRFPVVTLAGQLIQTSGAMSGGGQPSRGKMASQAVEAVSALEMAQLERDLSLAEVEIAELRTLLSTLQEKESQLRAQVPHTSTELEMEKLTLESLAKHMQNAKSKKHKIRDQIQEHKTNDEQRTAVLETEIKSRQLKKSNLEKESAALEVRIAEFQQQILAIGGVELQAATAKVNDLTDATQRLADQRQSILADQKKIAATLKRHISQLEEARSEREKLLSKNQSTDSELQEHKRRILELETQTETVKGQLLVVQSEISDMKENQTSLQSEIEEFKTLEISLGNKLSDCQSSLKGAQQSQAQLNHEMSLLKLHDLSVAQDLRNPDESSQSPVSFNELTPDELDGFNIKSEKDALHHLEDSAKDTHVNMDDLQSYVLRFNEYRQRLSTYNDAAKALRDKESEYERVKRRRFDEFMTGYNIISKKLKEMYKLITVEGNAELELCDTFDPFTEGISISVMPPKKGWKNISNLSGGEKTLSSLALVFALHHYKPTPLYVMDEIDAALDYRNVSIIADYIKERTKNGQFIVISLRYNMFELADRLIGITKYNNMTTSVTIDIKRVNQQLEALTSARKAGARSIASTQA